MQTGQKNEPWESWDNEKITTEKRKREKRSCFFLFLTNQSRRKYSLRALFKHDTEKDNIYV